MKNRLDQVMWDKLFKLNAHGRHSLQAQLREQLVSAILDGHIPIDNALPSSRELSKKLEVARNTVVLAYQRLIDEGFLITRERKGYYVNPDILRGRVSGATARSATVCAGEKSGQPSGFKWAERFKFRPSEQRNIVKPTDWDQYRYPFIYGQPDPSLVPVADWRECFRQALSVDSIKETARDRVDSDDPLLIEQIHARLLPRRGIWASQDEILVTLGAQHALYLLASLLVSNRDTVGVEDPGYPDARNIFAKHTHNIVGLTVDSEGLVIDDSLADCDCVYVTPSHQAPTTVTLSAGRRHQLLERAAIDDFLIIEDDYEAETNFTGDPTPALKANDAHNRVIYLGSLSKTLAPGLRMGFMVGPPELIEEARTLRRLMLRHPPSNNQRMVALFLSLGHHDSLINRLNQSYRRRWQVMGEALRQHLPETHQMPAFGGTSVWIKGASDLDANALYQQALKKSIVIERGDVYFISERPPKNFFRLGYSSIAEERIEPGIRALAELIHVGWHRQNPSSGTTPAGSA